MTGALPDFALLAHVAHWVAPVGLAFDVASYALLIGVYVFGRSFF